MRDKLEPTKARGVFRRVRDGRLVIRVTAVEPKTGKLREKCSLTEPGTTLNEAEKLAVQRRASIADAAGRIPTLVDYLERWVRRKAERKAWRPGSMTGITTVSCFENLVLPRLGEHLASPLDGLSSGSDELDERPPGALRRQSREQPDHASERLDGEKHEPGAKGHRITIARRMDISTVSAAPSCSMASRVARNRV